MSKNEPPELEITFDDPRFPNFRWTVERKIFARAIAYTGNVVEAAKAAGVTQEWGTNMLKEPAILHMAGQIVADACNAEDITDESLLARMNNWAHSDPFDVFDETWSIRPLNQITETVRKQIKSVKVSFNARGDRNISVEFYDAMKATEVLMRAKGMTTGVGDSAQPPEETAQELQRLLQKMEEADAVTVQPVPVEKSTGKPASG